MTLLYKDWRVYITSKRHEGFLFKTYERFGYGKIYMVCFCAYIFKLFLLIYLYKISELGLSCENDIKTVTKLEKNDNKYN